MQKLLLVASLAVLAVVSVSAAHHTTSHAIGRHVVPRASHEVLQIEEPGGPGYPMGGNVWPIAIYYMYINVGTPALPYCVAIDTGSTTAAVSDVSCTTCSQNPVNYNYYNTSKSSTSKLQEQGGYGGSYETCEFADPGATCSDSGDLYSDTTGIGSASMANYQIGSMTYVSSNFDQFKVCGGIMGLFGDTLFSELVTAGQYSQNIFGMCLYATEGAESNGTINFGGVDTSLYTGEIQWTPNVDGVEFYGVQVNSVSVLGASITSIAGEAVLDSGTNVILLNQQPFTDIFTAFNNSCQEGSNLHGVCDMPVGSTIFDGACYAYTDEQLAALPDLTFNLQNAVLTVPASNYMNLYDPLGPNPDYYCLGLRVSSAGFIVGDVLMSNYYVVFDNVNTRIGWATASENCGNMPMPGPNAPGKHHEKIVLHDE